MRPKISVLPINPVIPVVVTIVCLTVLISGQHWGVQAGEHSLPPSGQCPNVLMIVVDDLNAWVGCVGGHPLAQTPHMDGLASRGTVFVNAHVQAPLCMPSRASVLMGLRPSTTGLYGLEPWLRTVERWQNWETMPQYFRRHGYFTLTAGKVYHAVPPKDREGEFDIWGPLAGVGVRPPKKLIPPTPMGNHPLMDWGVFDHRDEEKGDWYLASWAAERLRDMSRDRPFFMAVGFFLPHVPCYVTQRWMDLYPDDDKVLPPVRWDDREDTPRFSWYLHWYLPEPRLRWVVENNQWRNLVRSYLASISFVDSQIGRVLEALDHAGLRENTIVVLWGDNGYHLGEKLITGKNTLWEPSTRVPLIFAGPKIFRGGRCVQPVELLDIFPTLIDLCGLPPRSDLEGISLAPQLKDPSTPRTRPAITTHNQNNHGVRSLRWRYIRYADGSEELYDIENDPHEWHNLAGDPRYQSIIEEHRRWLPQVNAPPVAGSAHRVLTYDPETGKATWEGKPIGAEDPIPE
jgi:choline-sulfatase